MSAPRKRKWLRRLAIVGIVLAVLAGAGWYALDRAGGDWKHEPWEIDSLSPAARELVAAAFADLDPDRLLDHHVHVVGTGSGGADTWVNPRMESPAHPLDFVRFAVYRDAAGVGGLDRADEGYLRRLTDLVDHFPGRGRFALLAFDWRYDEAGEIDRENSMFHVGDARVLKVADRRPKRFVPAISVHPARADAIAALENGAAHGVKLVKWLPNAMRIDPSSPVCDPFYDRMRELGMVLLTHGGEEQAVNVPQDQRLGNPLLLRRALEHGVKVIVAHCASLGEGEDLDHPGAPPVPNFELFLRMMDEPRWRGLLYGGISALTQYNRFDPALITMLARSDLHDRLVNGSDYPLPAVNFVVRLGKLESAGLLTADERDALREIYDLNPLLFDYVLKRTVHHPETGRRFPPGVFLAKPDLVP